MVNRQLAKKLNDKEREEKQGDGWSDVMLTGDALV